MERPTENTTARQLQNSMQKEQILIKKQEDSLMQESKLYSKAIIDQSVLEEVENEDQNSKTQMYATFMD